MTYARDTALLPADLPLADRQSIDFLAAANDLDDACNALAHFLTGEVVKADARLAPCECGHVAMFCACTVGEDIFGDGK